MDRVNATIAIIVLFLGINLLRQLSLRLQKRSVWLFLLGISFFFVREWLGIMNIRYNSEVIELIRELAETSFIFSIAIALYFFK